MDCSPIDESCSADYKRQFELLLSSAELDRFLAMDAIERALAQEDDYFAELSCPYCYEIFAAVPDLCGHVEVEHCFEARPVACPICSTRVKSDLSRHIASAHGALHKDARRRPPPHGRPSQSAASLLSSLAKDLSPRPSHVEAVVDQIIQSVNEAPAAADAFVSKRLAATERLKQAPPALSSPAAPAAASSSSSAYPGQLDAASSSTSSAATYRERDEQQEQVAMRAAFTQSVVLSTIFRNI